MPPRKPEPKAKRTTPKTEAKDGTKAMTNPAAAPKVKPGRKVATPKAAKVAAETKPGDKAKPETPPPAPRAFRDLVLSEPWMLPWAEAAVATGSATDACTEVGISIADFAKARKRDSVFDGICRVHKELVDLRIVDRLCSVAIRGDARHMALYFSRVRDLLFNMDAKPSDALFSASVAEAMVRAGLAAGETPPVLKPSQPKAKPTQNSTENPDDE